MSADENVIKKVFNDPIHGHIELHPILVEIIDTPQFQRLRNLKQLGGAYFVYPGASHNRFEHSIGVCHLAGQLVEALRSRQPELQITPQDVLCVQIAGLCHDLGHGPFSHLFDGMYIPEALKKKGQQSEQWKHETASVQMFLDLVKNNKLKEKLKKFFLDQDFKGEMASIKTMIEGLPHTDTENQQSGEGQEEESVKMFHDLVKNNELEEPMKKIFLKEYKVFLNEDQVFFLDEDQVFKDEMALIKKVIEGFPHTDTQSGEGLGEGSVKMFHNLVKSNKLKETMKKFFQHQVFNKEMVFIKEMIEGLPNTDTWSGEGRGEDKSFLYEIVSNKLNGIDVDKFDYLARDCYHLGIQNSFDHRRFLKFARVCEVKELKSSHICTRDKMVDDMYDLFNTRYRLHRRVCYHRVTNIIQIMIRDAFLMAEEQPQIKVSDTETFNLFTARNNMKAYIQLTDTVFDKILNSKDPNLENAKEVLQRIISRDLYKLLGEKKGGKDENENKALISQWKTELTQELPEGLVPEDFEVMPITYDYGMGEDDPFDSIYFYTKKDNKVASIIPKEERPKLVTNEFSEKIIRFYFKKTDKVNLMSAEEHFKKWKKQVQSEPNPAKKAKKNN